MKNLVYLLAVIFLGGTTVSNATTNKSDNDQVSTSVKGYGNSFIFVEGGIEFSVFPDGQFDFYMQNYGPNVNVSINTPNASFSFNNGYDYGAYVQYDEFGAIIQIENIPIFYDWYGRVSRIGNIDVYYTSYGYVNRIGGLYVYYDRHRVFSHCSGYINVFNPYYVFRPWHVYYRIPAYDYCVVYNQPYRRYYTPVRYTYHAPYVNNYRRTTAIASRRGSTIERNSRYATVQNSNNSVRRNTNVAPNIANEVRSSSTRRNETARTSTSRSNNRVSTPQNSSRNERVTSSNNSRTRNNSSITKTRENSVKNRSVEKPSNNSIRKYNSNNNKSRSSQLAQNSNNGSRNAKSRR